jgi:hypothetical protein
MLPHNTTCATTVPVRYREYQTGSTGAGAAAVGNNSTAPVLVRTQNYFPKKETAPALIVPVPVPPKKILKT